MSFWERLRDSFVAGLVLIMPLVITLYILQLLTGFAFVIIDPVVQWAGLESYTANVEIVARILAAVFIVLAITFLGYVGQKRFGQRLFGRLGRSVALIPIFRTIYSTVRQISQSFSNSESSYDSLVLVEFPRKDLYTIGLVTSESPQEVSDVAGTTVYNVFLPSSPNPASGRLVLVPEDELHEVDLSVRQGMGLLMTTGAGSDRPKSVPTAVNMSRDEVIAALEELEDAQDSESNQDVDRVGEQNNDSA